MGDQTDAMRSNDGADRPRVVIVTGGSTDPTGPIGTGRVVRVVVDRERFLEKAGLPAAGY